MATAYSAVLKPACCAGAAARALSAPCAAMTLAVPRNLCGRSSCFQRASQLNHALTKLVVVLLFYFPSTAQHSMLSLFSFCTVTFSPSLFPLIVVFVLFFPILPAQRTSPFYRGEDCNEAASLLATVHHCGSSLLSPLHPLPLTCSVLSSSPQSFER